MSKLQVDSGFVKEVNVTVLVDNYDNGTLMTAWGLSMLIETENLTILMDAGPNPDILQTNAEALEKDLSNVDCTVISHQHADHTSGLSYIAELIPNSTVYVPEHMEKVYVNEIQTLGLEVISINNTTHLSAGISIIGEMESISLYEQALAVNVEEVGIVLFVGCSHPGVENLVSKSVQNLQSDPYLVIGGFHLFQDSEKYVENTASELIDLGLNRIYPNHCSGDSIRNHLQRNYPQYQPVAVQVGTQLEISAETAQTVMDSRRTSFSVFTVITIILLIPILKQYLRKRRY
ncbi:MAG: MBL fold metallo-hydrolase [Candidatus Heimdallarchaeaceae archaeon]